MNTDWQPIDTAPKNGTIILVYCPLQNVPFGTKVDSHVCLAVWSRQYTDGYDPVDGGLYRKVERELFNGWVMKPDNHDLYWHMRISEKSRIIPTHWMPLPEPPNQMPTVP